MSNRGRSQKGRGYRCEKRIEARFAEFGFKRNAMSGALGGDHAGDLARPARVHVTHRREDCQTHAVTEWQTVLERTAVLRLECKHRERGWPVLRKWLAQGDAHALVLDEGARVEPLVVMAADTFAALLREAGYADDLRVV